MDSMLDQLTGRLDRDSLTRIAAQIGSDEASAGQGLSAALPLLMGALSRNASSTEGAQSLHDALARDHDGSLLDNLSSYLQQPENADGPGILRHVLGEQRPQVEERLAASSGLNVSSASRLLELAAPLLMAFLGRKQREQGFGINDLSSWLGGQKDMAAQAEPGLMGMVTGWLDQNDDGSVMDDLKRIAGRLFGGKEEKG